MSTKTKKWKSKETPQTDEVVKALKKEFKEVDAYRYNSASIRVRVVDPRFSGMSAEHRDAMVEPLLAQLPVTIQADIINLLAIAPEEMSELSGFGLRNLEFEDPRPSRL